MLRDLSAARVRDLGVASVWNLDGALLRDLDVALLCNVGVPGTWNIWVAWVLGYGNKRILRWRLAGLFHLVLLRLRGWGKGLLLLVGTHAAKDAGPQKCELLGFSALVRRLWPAGLLYRE